MVQQEIIIAGFGGQGILSAGRLIAYAGMLENKNVSWLPSYGPEMRGGTANCNVIVTDGQVGSPILNSATSLIAMNEPSLMKFEKIVEKNGIIILDSYLIKQRCTRKDVKVFPIPATQIATEMGNQLFANVILLGKLAAETNVISKQSFEQALIETLPKSKHELIPDEIKAFELGMNYK